MQDIGKQSWIHSQEEARKKNQKQKHLSRYLWTMNMRTVVVKVVKEERQERRVGKGEQETVVDVRMKGPWTINGNVSSARKTLKVILSSHELAISRDMFFSAALTIPPSEIFSCCIME